MYGIRHIIYHLKDMYMVQDRVQMKKELEKVSKVMYHTFKLSPVPVGDITFLFR